MSPLAWLPESSRSWQISASTASGPSGLLFRVGLRDARLLGLYALSFGVGIGANAVTMPVLVARCFAEL